MGRARRRTSIAVALAAGLTLTACDSKETGPEQADTMAEAPATATPVPAATADPGAAKPLLSFAGMDGDGDARVSSAEQAKASQTMFQAMDADKDGAVTLAEMDAARDAIGERPDLASEKLIRSADADSDGKLTLGEWVADSNARFSRFDKDADGTIDSAEWRAGVAAETSAAPAKP